jgi:hypothetical protein
MLALSNETSPRTTSRTTVVPSGTRNRSLLGRQVAVVRVAGGEESLGRGDVGGRVRALEVRPLECRVVGADAQPRQRVDDPLSPLRTVTSLVGVLDPEHEPTAQPPGERPVEQRRAGPADVEEPGR